MMNLGGTRRRSVDTLLFIFMCLRNFYKERIENMMPWALSLRSTQYLSKKTKKSTFKETLGIVQRVKHHNTFAMGASEGLKFGNPGLLSVTPESDKPGF